MYNGSELWKKRIPLNMTEIILDSGRKIETYPGLPANLYRAVAKYGESRPEKTAVVDSFGHCLTYRGLKNAADSFASVLKYKFGVDKGSHVALMMYSSAEFCVAFLALVKLGAIAVLLPTKYKQKEIWSLLDKSDAQHVILDTDYRAYFEGYQEKGLTLIEYHSSRGAEIFDGVMEEGYPEAEEKGGYEDTVVMMFTSGTSSASKAVMLTNYSYMHAAATYRKLFDITEKDSTVIPVPIYMITGLSALLGTMLFSGGTVYMQQFFKAEEVLRCVQEKQVTFLHAAPTVYSLLVRERDKFPKLESLRCLACGGARSPRQMIEKIHDWLPDCEFRTVYGMTETASPAAVLPENAAKSPEMESNGVPIPGMKFKIVDEEGKELPAGELGELLLYGTNLLECYYKMDTPLYKDGWLHTGDMGYFTEEGYCYVVDRKKDMINRGGEKVVSSDVERELLQIDGVEEAAVVGIPSEVYGEAPAAVIRKKEGSTLDEQQIRDRLRREIAGYKVPERIVFVEEIPLTPNGKYDKKNMKALF